MIFSPGKLLSPWPLLAWFAAILPAYAQVTGEIRGRALDPHGGVLAGVTVLVSSKDGTVAGRGTVTDAAGVFRVPALPPGEYGLRASCPQRATVVLSDIEVSPARPTEINVILLPESSVRETVQVRATPQVVALEETTTASRYSSEFIDALPILGRDYQDVLTLAPGVTDVDGDGNPNIHGARDTDVLTMVDGVTTSDPLTGKVGAQLNIESIQEIEVKTSGATAEFGRAQGGTVSILTKSGGNRFEGAAKIFWRSSRLDGDGAGSDDPRLHGGVGEIGLRELRFDDYMPFLSLSGPIVRDHAWFFVTLERIQQEEPVNALSAAFVTTHRESRQFAKVTWQISPANRLALSINHDPQEFLNQGLNSQTREETGFTTQAGGTFATLRDTAILSPTVALETTLGWFGGRPGLIPNLGPDTNGNGLLYTDRGGNGFREYSERDAGDDWDHDGNYDVYEDWLVKDGMLSERELCCWRDYRTQLIVCSCPPPALVDEDTDHDRRLTPSGGCEGAGREDVDCDGWLDRVDEDKNHNGMLDFREDLDGDGRLDRGTEDRNGNKLLDDTPHPTGDYPYGRTKPEVGDRDYTINLFTGFVSGPYLEQYDDTRGRGSLRQDLTLFVPWRGTHDLKAGYLLERESFTRETTANALVGIRDLGYNTGKLIDKIRHPELNIQCNPYETKCVDPGLGRIAVSLPLDPAVSQGGGSWSSGAYVQDLYRPLPNLSVGLGVRFDREVASSNGYTFFDPAAERVLLDRLLALSGGEIGRDDLTMGNGDGVQSLGVLADPWFFGKDPVAILGGPLLTPLRLAALRHMTMHRDTIAFGSTQLAQLFPGIIHPGDLDAASLAALGVPIQHEESFGITNNNLAPRLSISWDPFSDGRTKAYATWGRYYDKLFLNAVVGEQGIERVQRYYVLNRNGFDVVNGVSQSDNGVGATLSSAPPSVTQVDRNLQTPYSDEWTVGLEREVAPEVSLAVRFIHRRYRDQLQDVDLNHEVRMDPSTGRAVDRFGVLVQVPGATPGAPSTTARAPDGRPDLFIHDFFFNQVLRIGNYNQARYDGLELELRRRLSRRWEMQGSYTYSRALGSAEDFQSRLGNDPSTTALEDGYMSFDQRHVVKLNGVMFLPGDWQLGAAATWSSGLPYSVISRFFALDNSDYQQYRTLFGTVVEGPHGLEFHDERRNSRRNGAILDVNMRGSKSLVIGRCAAQLSLEVFNLLNRDDLTVYSVDPSRNVGFDAKEGAVLAGPLQLDATRRFGRRWQVGFQIAF